MYIRICEHVSAAAAATILPPAVLSRVVVVFHVIISKHGRLAPDQYIILQSSRKRDGPANLNIMRPYDSCDIAVSSLIVSFVRVITMIIYSYIGIGSSLSAESHERGRGVCSVPTTPRRHTVHVMRVRANSHERVHV